MKKLTVLLAVTVLVYSCATLHVQKSYLSPNDIIGLVSSKNHKVEKSIKHIISDGFRKETVTMELSEKTTTYTNNTSGDVITLLDGTVIIEADSSRHFRYMEMFRKMGFKYINTSKVNWGMIMLDPTGLFGNKIIPVPSGTAHYEKKGYYLGVHVPYSERMTIMIKRES